MLIFVVVLWRQFISYGAFHICVLWGLTTWLFHFNLRICVLILSLITKFHLSSSFHLIVRRNIRIPHVDTVLAVFNRSYHWSSKLVHVYRCRSCLITPVLCMYLCANWTQDGINHSGAHNNARRGPPEPFLSSSPLPLEVGPVNPTWGSGGAL